MSHVLKVLVNVLVAQIYEVNFRCDFKCVHIYEQGLLKVNTFNKIIFPFNTFLFPSITSLTTLHIPLHDYYCCTISSPLSSKIY